MASAPEAPSILPTPKEEDVVTNFVLPKSDVEWLGVQADKRTRGNRSELLRSIIRNLREHEQQEGLKSA